MEAQLHLLSNNTKTPAMDIINNLLEECYGVRVEPTHAIQSYTAGSPEGSGIRYSKTSDNCYDYVGVVVYGPNSEIRLGATTNSGNNRITAIMRGQRDVFETEFTANLWSKLKECHDNRLSEPHAVVCKVDDLFYNYGPFVTKIEMNVKNFNHLARYIVDDALALSAPEILLGIDDIAVELYLKRIQTQASYFLDSVCHHMRYPTDVEHLHDAVQKIPDILKEDIALAGNKGDACGPVILKPYLVGFVANVLRKFDIAPERWVTDWQENEKFCYDLYWQIRHSADVEKLDKFFKFINEENDGYQTVYK